MADGSAPDGSGKFLVVANGRAVEGPSWATKKEAASAAITHARQINGRCLVVQVVDAYEPVEITIRPVPLHLVTV